MLRVTDGIRNPKVMVATRGGGMTEEDFDHSVLPLVRQRPGAAEKLE